MTTLTGTEFKAAKPWGWLIAFVRLLNRFTLSRHTTLDVRASDLALLQSLPPACLIAPNHAHYADPQVTLELARRAGRRVIFMATREAFDMGRGWWGWCLQHLGVFSVNRGGENTEARRFARDVLIAGLYDLVMFPEGEIYLLNDLVMPLKPGVARLALEAAIDLRQQGRPRPILIVPVAIKYHFTGDITPNLEANLAGLEARIAGEVRTGPLYPRIVRLGTELLDRAERAYGVTPVPGIGVFERVRGLRRALQECLEQTHFGRVQEGFDFDRARKLMIRIQELLLAKEGQRVYYAPPAAPPADALTADLEAARLCARSVAFHEDYLLENPTSERMAETLTKLEREVLGQEIRAPLGSRRAVIRIAPPIDVREYLRDDSAPSSLDGAIERIVIRLHQTLQGTLDAIAREEGRPKQSGAEGRAAGGPLPA
jgi:1-acyl-sn-glycerol-3-phosphate acyltransferase